MLSHAHPNCTPGGRTYAQVGRRFSDGAFQSLDSQSMTGSMVWSTSDYAVPHGGQMMYAHPIPVQMQQQQQQYMSQQMHQPQQQQMNQQLPSAHRQQMPPQQMVQIPRANSRQSLDMVGRPNPGRFPSAHSRRFHHVFFLLE